MIIHIGQQKLYKGYLAFEVIRPHVFDFIFNNSQARFLKVVTCNYSKIIK